MNFLRLKLVEFDPATEASRKWVEFIARGREVEPAGFVSVTDFSSISIKSLRLRDRPLSILLMEICDEAGVKWEIEDQQGKIVIIPRATGSRGTESDDPFFDAAEQVTEKDPFGQDAPE